MNRRRLLAKRRVLPSKAKPKDFEKQVEKAIREANERIKSISKKYKGTTYMWSFNKLKNKIGSRYIKNNRLKLPKNISRTELLKVYKEVESFLDSKESTKTGIKEIQTKAKETIRTELFNGDITDADVDVYYSLLEDKDFTSTLNKDFTASDYWVVIDDAIESNDTYEDFEERLLSYIDVETGNVKETVPDEALRKKIKNIYTKYVKYKGRYVDFSSPYFDTDKMRY